MASYRDLLVWQKAMEMTKEMTKEIYLLVKKLPKEETYVLSDQMSGGVDPIEYIRRAAPLCRFPGQQHGKRQRCRQL